MSKKVFIVGSCYSSYRMIEAEEGYELSDHPDNADLLLFTGGADIDPAIYGHKNIDSGCDNYRDQIELKFIDKYLGVKPLVGICRGAQMLCAVNGGTLYQDVNNHAMGAQHRIICNDGQELMVTSIHHQMMRPSGNHEVIAVSQPLATKRYFDGGSVMGQRDDDPEIIWWPDTKCYGFQGHPEYINYEHPCRRRFFYDINQLIFGE